jgi:hypothetical protein
MGSFKNWKLAGTEKLVLAAAAELGGADAAEVWYDIPLPDIGGLSPRRLVEAGRAHEVFEYLELLEADIPQWEQAAKPPVRRVYYN